MKSYPIEDVRHWYEEWFTTEQKHFACMLFDLIAKADIDNLERIRLGFPEFIQVWKEKKEILGNTLKFG